MAFTSVKVSFFWGALDIDLESAHTPAYAPTDYVSLGESAVDEAGIGVRRATLVLDRSAYSVADDAMLMHFDFLNITGGAPDDTWTTGDYSTIETLLNTWWNTLKGWTPAGTKLTRYYWHRVGAGVTKPNPAVRIADIATPVVSAASAFNAPPQAAMSISLRHGKRRSWGRTYLPYSAGIANGRAASTDSDAIVAATVTLLNGAKSADFAPVVTSVTHAQAFLIERVVCDNTVDIVRRRRFKHTTYIKSTALT